jgi:hypothetical protein
LSELRSAVERLQAEILAELPDAVVEEDFAELQRAVELLEVERLRRLAEIERRGIHERDGNLSVASWLASRFKVAWGTARESVRVARALEDMPLTQRSLEQGELSLSAARVLAAAHDTDREAFGRSESQLVQAARIHSTTDLQKIVSHWRQTVEAERSFDAEEKLLARRRLHASVTFLGMVRGDFDLDPEGGETVLTALGAVVDAGSRSGNEEDERTPAQRRADALVEICRQWLDLAERPTVCGERPHVTVTVAAESLVGADGLEVEPAAELDHVGPVPAQTVRRLACDSSVLRVVLSGRSEPLDVGRRTHVVPPSMRRAVIARDRRCRFPGCDRPHTWCDAHHVVHWADGGPTAANNLLLLCRRHHRMVHQRRFSLELLQGTPVFRCPDGSVLEDRAPP